MHQPHLIILLYDSVTNSVFESQLLAPYAALVEAESYATMTLITYEKQDFKKSTAYHTLQQQLQKYSPNISCHILQRPLLLGLFSLQPLVAPLRALLNASLPHVLVARGPISGYLAQQAASTQTQQLTIQARGLLYEEYCMTTQQAPWYMRPLHAYRARQYKKLEQQVYGATHPLPTAVEAVSAALAEHITTTYKPAVPLTLALHDTPHLLSKAERLQARIYYRNKLGISADAPVFAYNGSLKPWQCPDITFQFFKDQLTKDNKSVLLFISQESQQAQLLGATYNLPTHAVIYLSVPHQEVVPVLCAADYGLMFREQHIVNWTSRPTKLLEYQSAGLQIIHNNSIELLQHTPNSFYANTRLLP